MSKVVVKGKDIPLDQIKPSPYQPRLTFDLDDIKGSIMRDGILVTLTVRKKDGFYEMVDGERRWRVAKELGYKTVPCDIIDINDDTARRMVWKVNTLRKDYEPKEKAQFFKTMQEEYGMTLRGIAREYDTDRHTVNAYLNIFKLPEEYQQMVWDTMIPIRNIQELEQLFNGGVRTPAGKIMPKDNPQIFEMLDRSAREKHFGAEQIRETIKPYLARLRKEQVEKAKEALAEVKPEVKPPEKPEEFEEAAKALKKRAKELKTPKQILKEKQEKARKSLLTGKGNALSKVEKGKKLGIDTTEFEERIEEIKAKIVDDPDGALKEVKKLKGNIDKAIKDFEEKRKEEEIRRRLEKETRRKMEEELLKDKEFLAKASKIAKIEEAMEVVKTVDLIPTLTDEEIKAFKQSVQEYESRLREILNSDVVKKRGKLFKNWFGHTKIAQLLHLVTCPICKSPSTNIEWKCHHLTVLQASEKTREDYQKSLESDSTEN